MVLKTRSEAKRNNMSRVEEFTLDISPLSQNPRKIWVYLPDSYDRTKKKYDVLYMFDGHNLFFDEVATFGKSWGMKEYLDETKADLVVIGQDCNHIGSKRMDEYCPLEAERMWNEKPIIAEGMETARWFAEVLKPFCEERYRIYKKREHVGIGGSSMGGLMAEYFISKYNHVYSKAACISPAHYYCEKALKQIVKDAEFRESRIFMSYGSKELGDNVDILLYAADSMMSFNHLFTDKGAKTWPYLQVGGSHNEASWEKLLPLFVPWLYPDLF